MNLHEFAALKPGDEIENPMSGSRGRITEAKRDGVMVAWGWNNRPTPATAPTFFYSVNSTAWTHWNALVPIVR